MDAFVVPSTFIQQCWITGAFSSAARAAIGSNSGPEQRRATHSLTPTIGPSFTQRSSSCTLNSG